MLNCSELAILFLLRLLLINKIIEDSADTVDVIN